MYVTNSSYTVVIATCCYITDVIICHTALICYVYDSNLLFNHVILHNDFYSNKTSYDLTRHIKWFCWFKYTACIFKNIFINLVDIYQ